MRSSILGLVLVVFMWSYSFGSFNDISESRYEESIRYLAQKQIVKGYPDGSFGVDRQITRAEMMKIVMESSKRSIDSTASSCFTDVSKEWYASYICSAYRDNLISGIGSGLFGPQRSVTIAEGLKIALNAFGGMGVQQGSDDYWYEPYVTWFHQANILSMYDYYPNQPMTRGQMAFIIHQLMIYRPSQTQGYRHRLSKGCGFSAPSHVIDSFTVTGVVRHALVDIPQGYRNDQGYKLIIAWHGRTNSNEQIRDYMNLDLTFGKNSIVVYPAGLPEQGPVRSWNTVSDVGLFDEIVHRISESYCINMDEIYVVGHSLGGWFVNTLACVRGDVIRGVASVGGSITSKQCTGPVSVLLMHHPDDNLASFTGGIIARDQFLRTNHCRSDEQSVSWTPQIGHCVQYRCDQGAPVMRCPHTESYTWGRYYTHSRPSFATTIINTFWNQ